jgi:hypothetical protein
MHVLAGLAAILALVAMAFGARAASIVAAIVLIGGTVLFLWLGFLIVTERL